MSALWTTRQDTQNATPGALVAGYSSRRMGGLVEDAILRAAKSLSDRDVELAEEVRQNDKVIDALEEQINEEAARVIALRAPVSKDLRSILTVLRLAASLERIGDYAKNIAKRTSVIVEMGPINGSDTALRRMAREVEGMLKDTLDAYMRSDAELAENDLVVIGGTAPNPNVTVFFNVPMNEALAGMETASHTTRDYWMQTYVPRWTFWNSVRTLACAISAALLLIGLLWMTQNQVQTA